MDQQISDLIEATREQTSYELTRIRLEEERLALEKLRLEEEKRKALSLELLLNEVTVTNSLIRNDLLPGSAEQNRVLSTTVEIQRIILLVLITISDKSEERERLQTILSSLNPSNIKIDVKGNAENITGKRG